VPIGFRPDAPESKPEGIASVYGPMKPTK
jgi:hypothetical protein